MSDDWQEAAFSNRHTHNRGKGGKGGKANSHGFNVQKTFGSYEIKSPKFPPVPDGGNKSARLEVYTLNEAGNAIIGELFIPGCLNANVVLAGSRKVMKKVVRDLETREGIDESTEADDGRRSDGEDYNDEEDAGNEDDEEEPRENRKDQVFEKNSFRSPKFWLKWQGILSKQDTEGQLAPGDGYIVFSGNACDKFDGTLSCEELGWKNVKITGWKIKGLPARDFWFQWVAEKKEDAEEE